LYTDTDFAKAIEYADNLDSYSLLIWHKGALRLEQYYDGFDAELRAETASMHKSVLGLLIACAIEDGFIKDVDTRIGNFIEPWKDLSEGDITVRQLLTMSSGLNSLSFAGGFNSEAMKFNTGRLDARATILGLRLDKKPGTSFSYANTSSQLLALVLEAATGRPYAEYLSQRLWQAIGAADASVWYFEDDGFPRTFASLLARSRDWLKVGLLVKDQGKYQNKQIISAGLIKTMTSPSKANPNYGWQVWLGTEYESKRYYNDLKIGVAVPVSEAFVVNDMIYFDGFGGQRVYISEAEDLVIARTGDTRLDWDDSTLPNLVIKSLNDNNLSDNNFSDNN
jgi:CubicO group peptidase (beta-lactamase class C family)